MSFNIAECYRQKNDTTYLKWYRKNISTCQNVRDRHFCDKENRYFPKTARQSAYSSYYIHDYKRAEVFFQKLIAYFPRTEDYFMLGLILIKLEMLPEAIVEFNNFISKGGDRKKADEWIKFCEEKAKN
ncbi:MAG: hypothetical protein IPG08_10305 [Sphingobacteriaceae bacterium]|nr:hypothetical protein [Sphingobacteriaceae bacterium]